MLTIPIVHNEKMQLVSWKVILIYLTLPVTKPSFTMLNVFFAVREFLNIKYYERGWLTETVSFTSNTVDGLPDQQKKTVRKNDRMTGSCSSKLLVTPVLRAALLRFRLQLVTMMVIRFQLLKVKIFFITYRKHNIWLDLQLFSLLRLQQKCTANKFITF